MLAAGVFFGGILFSNTKKSCPLILTTEFWGWPAAKMQHQEREEQSSKLAQALGGGAPVNVKRWKQGHMPSKTSTAVRRKKKKRVESCGNFVFFFFWWHKMGRWEESIYLPFQLEILVLLKTAKLLDEAEELSQQVVALQREIDELRKQLLQVWRGWPVLVDHFCFGDSS